MARARTNRAVVGATPLASAFFSGRYAEVVGATFEVGGGDDVDAAFVVGALAFLGRVEDAETCFDTYRKRAAPADARTLAASRFFLGVAYARAGAFERAHALLVQGALARVRTRDAWAAAFALQGLAVHRYFTGRYRTAARHAQRASRAAHEARVAYVQMIATDLRGHALVQLGLLSAGLAVLERASLHAERMGLGMNAFAITCSMATYSARFLARPAALERLRELLRLTAHDSYTRRALLTEEAIVLAFRGQRTEAERSLALADDDALRQDARRAKVASLLARLWVARFSSPAVDCDALLARARAVADDEDVAYQAELLGFEAFIARATADEPRRLRALDDLRALAQKREHHRARAALEQFDDAPALVRAMPEDEITPLLRAAVTRDTRLLPKILELGANGLVPELLGLAPSRRVLLLAAENALVVEDAGDVFVKPNPPRWSQALLRLLARGAASKEQIVAALWGLRVYRPERHDALVRTTIHRLRALLAPRGNWIAVTELGYGATVPVLAFGAAETSLSSFEIAMDAPFLDEVVPRGARGLRAGPPAHSPTLPARDQASTLASSPEARVLEHLARSEPRSVTELARRLGLSSSTVLRALRRLLRAKRVARAGHARATRYRALD